MKLLVIRLSSLGDVILSTSFLNALPEGVIVDWVIAKDFAFILRGHPKIRKLFEYDKKEGLIGWLKLIHHLAHQEYDLRIDLHRNLRSQLARVFFHWMDFTLAIWVPWHQISKQRFRFWGYVVFKKLWPRFMRPVPFHLRFSQLAKKITKSDSSIEVHPSMVHLLKNGNELLQQYSLESKKYFVVMPSSRWPSKEWSLDSYFRLCRDYSFGKNLTPVVMGRQSDSNAVSLVQLLNDNHIPFRSALNENDFSNTATLMHHSAFYLGSDTGLAHLAEAVGIPGYFIFGPTRPDLGFGPWRADSKALSSKVWCSPCSKDGRICYRWDERFACLKQISVQQVLESLP